MHETLLQIGYPVLFLLPSVLALVRRHRQRLAICGANLAMPYAAFVAGDLQNANGWGWASIAWAAVLVWALTASRAQPKTEPSEPAQPSALGAALHRRMGLGEALLALVVGLAAVGWMALHA